MADNLHEEQTLSQSNDRAENILGQQVPVAGNDYIQQIQETEKMEVHHHPHQEKKSFKEYLVEGLMIFIAVMMGFISENVHEDITEHHRAKVLAESMIMI